MKGGSSGLEMKFVNVEIPIPYIKNAINNNAVHVARNIESYGFTEKEQVI